MSQKNYIGFVNDHSGSMHNLASAAIKDYNTNITAVKDAASREMLDTVVSVVGVGIGDYGYGVERQVQVSNPHVLKPVTSWYTGGGTPLYDGIGSMIDLLDSLPDAKNENVSFLVMVTTDGYEMHSRKETVVSLTEKISRMSRTGRWTFVFRVPVGAGLESITRLGIPLDNIQQWDTTSEGLAKSTAQTTQAMDTYFSARSAGVKSSNSFYANAASVDTSKLQDVTKKVSLYVVPQNDNGIEIRPFILRHRMQMLNGAAFYQLTKTEARISTEKEVLVRNRKDGKFFGGAEARKMIGLPSDRNARLHPGDHQNYDIFIQSNSVNRKLVGGTGVAYWEEKGRPFTDADLAYLKQKTDAVVQLPVVPVSTTPTKSPIPVQKKVTASVLMKFRTRDEAREYCRKQKLNQAKHVYRVVHDVATPWHVMH